MISESNWEKKHIHHSHNIISKIKAHKNYKKNQLMTYFFIAVLTLIAHLLIAQILLPLLLILPAFPRYLTLVLIGLCFGIMFDSAVRTIESHEHFILVHANHFIAILTILIFFLTAQSFEENLNISMTAALLYTVSFMLPYSFTHKKKMY